MLLYEKYRFSITFSNKLGGFYCGLMCVFILCYSGVFNLQERGARGAFAGLTNGPSTGGPGGRWVPAGSSGPGFRESRALPREHPSPASCSAPGAGAGAGAGTGVGPAPRPSGSDRASAHISAVAPGDAAVLPPPASPTHGLRHSVCPPGPRNIAPCRLDAVSSPPHPGAVQGPSARACRCGLSWPPPPPCPKPPDCHSAP